MGQYFGRERWDLDVTFDVTVLHHVTCFPNPSVFIIGYEFGSEYFTPKAAISPQGLHQMDIIIPPSAANSKTAKPL
jgi:hypothetical protein